ncbi:expressed unknown protein [Seminavis robusta]|uniref:Uncharacterized protein n=1 Tax=Seminavis robusta TaxID=568900 RepID=A0A9N8HG24_9STRA|nr:expressed unknown protein [Seminavis robusta]|eukprot:Sro487_g152810.1 n/a (303) ;mRNA; f:17515-18423
MSELPLNMTELANHNRDNVAEGKAEVSQAPTPTLCSWLCPAIRAIVMGIIGLLLLLSNISHIYVIVTWESKQACIASGIKEATEIAPFVWLTTWVLWLSTAFYIWYLYLIFSKPSMNHESKAVQSWGFRCLFQVALCWSTITVLAYTGSLILTPPSTDAIDTDLCYSFSDSIIQKSQPNAIFWLVMDRIFNFTAHYVCGLALLLLYLQRAVAYDIGIPFSVLVLIPFSVVLGLVHTFHSPVYDVENIWLSSAGVIIGALVIHGLLWCASGRSMAQVSGEPSEESKNTEVEETVDNEVLADEV